MYTVVQAFDFGRVRRKEIIVEGGVIVFNDQRLPGGIRGVGSQILQQHRQGDIEARIVVGRVLMASVAGRVARIQGTPKFIVVLTAVVGKQATPTTPRFGDALHPLHRDKTASIPEDLESLRRSLTELFQISFRVMD